MLVSPPLPAMEHLSLIILAKSETTINLISFLYLKLWWRFTYTIIAKMPLYINIKVNIQADSLNFRLKLPKVW